VTVRDRQVSVVFPPGERVDIWLGDEVRYRRDDITWPAA
jgi:hypothetical protein